MFISKYLFFFATGIFGIECFIFFLCSKFSTNLCGISGRQSKWSKTGGKMDVGSFRILWVNLKFYWHKPKLLYGINLLQI